MEWPHDFKTLLSAFNAENVRYLLIGGYAVAHHGHPRFTADLDLWIEPSESNSKRIRSALESMEITLPPVAFSNLQSKGQLIRLGTDPTRVDLLTSIPELEFEASYSRADFDMIGGVKVPVINLGDLITTKKATGRFQDLADVEALENR